MADGRNRIRAAYVLTAPTRAAARAKARDMVVEQTAEVPATCISQRLWRTVVGTIERVAPVGRSRWRIDCTFEPGIVGDSVPQLFNLLFGNISMLQGIRLVDLDLPALPGLPGPAYGIPGLRQICGVPRGPLLCAASKPIGLSARHLARICHAFASGGAHIVKDDHGLANQPPAPFRERVARCQEAVERANAKTGGRTVYFPNLSRGLATLPEDLEYVRSLGCRGVLLSPLLVGPDAVRHIAAGGTVAVLSHPTFTGTLVQPGHGIAPDVLFGTLFRMIGSDGVIYPNAGGRFPFSLKSCLAINQRLRQPLDGARPAFPVPGGGVDVAHVPALLHRHGPDTMFLVGSSLYAQRDLATATAHLVDTMRKYDHA